MKEPGIGRKVVETSVGVLNQESLTKICVQVEYYFSDSNLPTDDFLLNIMEESKGWVPLETLSNFPRIKQLLEKAKREIVGIDEIKHLADALRLSETMLQVSEDGLLVKRVTPLQDPQLVADRTVAVFGLPSKRPFNVDEQKMFWGQFGGVMSVKRYVPDEGRAPRCMVFVEFDTKEIAQDVLATQQLDYDGVEVTLKKRLLPTKRKRRRGGDFEDRLIKLSGFPRRSTFRNIKAWIENQDVEARFFVHHKKDHAYIRFMGDMSAKEVVKKLENKQWAPDKPNVKIKAEVIDDGGVTWKSLVREKSGRRKKRIRRGSREFKGTEKTKSIDEKKMDEDSP